MHTTAGQLQNGAKCLTDGHAVLPTRNITAVFGRPLTSALSPKAGGYAVLLVNDGEAHAEVKCDVNCVKAMVLPASFPDSAFVRDLWSHEVLQPIAGLRNGFSMAVEAGGASRMVKLCATAAECEQRA